MKESGSKTLSDQVYDYHVLERVQYEDNDWEELS